MRVKATETAFSSGESSESSFAESKVAYPRVSEQKQKQRFLGFCYLQVFDNQFRIRINLTVQFDIRQLMLGGSTKMVSLP